MMQRLLFQQARQVVLRSSRVLSSHQRTPPKIIPSHHSCTSRFFSQWYEADENENEPKTALVIGSNGCLGSTICKHLGRQGVSVIGVDLTSKDDADPTLSGFVSLSNSKPGNLTELTTDLYSGVSDILNETSSPQCLSAIIVAAGGWQGDTPVAADDPIQGAAEYAAVMDAMQSQNLHPVLAAGYLIPYFMVPSNGLFVAIGATPALGSTPGMLGYGQAKVGVHHYVSTLGDSTGLSVTTKSKRQQSKALRRSNHSLDTLSVIGVLPTTIDTPANRKNMPGADTSQWTPPNEIAKQVSSWVEEPLLRPHSGSLVKAVTLPGKGTSFQLVR